MSSLAGAASAANQSTQTKTFQCTLTAFVSHDSNGRAPSTLLKLLCRLTELTKLHRTSSNSNVENVSCDADVSLHGPNQIASYTDDSQLDRYIPRHLANDETYSKLIADHASATTRSLSRLHESVRLLLIDDPAIVSRGHIIYERIYVNNSEKNNKVRVWKNLRNGVEKSEFWQMSAAGRILLDRPPNERPAVVRPIIISSFAPAPPSMHPPCHSLLEFLNFRFDFERIREGFLFTLDDRQIDMAIDSNTGTGSKSTESVYVDVHVFRMIRIESQHVLSSGVPLSGFDWICEVSARANEDSLTYAQNRVEKVANLLKPIVYCSKLIDEETEK